MILTKAEVIVIGCPNRLAFAKAEINSFLSESSDARIHGRLLIASTDHIGVNQ
jgi:hypothetical protein